MTPLFTATLLLLVLRVLGQVLVRQAELITNDVKQNFCSYWAAAVSSDGNVSLVGASWKSIGGNTGQNAAYVFVNNGSTWSQVQRLTASDGSSNDGFGISVSLSVNGSVMLVGANGKSVGGNNSQGAAYVFVNNGTSWVQEQRLTANDGSASDFFGRSVAVSSNGSVLLVGAEQKIVGGNAGQGAVYVYLSTGDTWLQVQRLTASDGSAGDYFGYSVSLSSDGGVVLVGAKGKSVGGNSSQGAVYVFVNAGSAWSQVQRLIATDGSPFGYFGHSLSLSSNGSVALVGANGFRTYQGAAYVFVRDGSTWVQAQRLGANDGVDYDNFGTSVALSSNGSVALVSAPFKGAVTFDGAAYLFVSNGSVWLQVDGRLTNAGLMSNAVGGCVSLSSDASVALVGVGYPSFASFGNFSEHAAFTYAVNSSSLMSLTASPTMSSTVSISQTQSQSVSQTSSPSQIQSTSLTSSPSHSQTASPSKTQSNSLTSSPSHSQTLIPSQTQSASFTSSPSHSQSPSSALAQSPSMSESSSLTLSPSQTLSASLTQSLSEAPSLSPSYSRTQAPSSSQLQSSSQSPSQTLSPSNSREPYEIIFVAGSSREPLQVPIAMLHSPVQVSDSLLAQQLALWLNRCPADSSGAGIPLVSVTCILAAPAGPFFNNTATAASVISLYHTRAASVVVASVVCDPASADPVPLGVADEVGAYFGTGAGAGELWCRAVATVTGISIGLNAKPLVVAATLWPLWDDVFVATRFGALMSPRRGYAVNGTAQLLHFSGALRLEDALKNSSAVLAAVMAVWSSAGIPNPAASPTAFSLTLGGSAILILRALRSRPAFGPGTTATLGGAACTVGAISDDGQWILLTTPPANESCTGAASSSPSIDCGYLTLVVNTSASAEAATGAFPSRGVALPCPPFCPGALGDSLVPVALPDGSFGMATHSSLGVGMASSMLEVPVDASTGVYYAELCARTGEGK